MSSTPKKPNTEQNFKTSKKPSSTKLRTLRSKDLIAVENTTSPKNNEKNSGPDSDSDEIVEILVEDSDEIKVVDTTKGRRRSRRVTSPVKRYMTDLVIECDRSGTRRRRKHIQKDESTNIVNEDHEDNIMLDTVQKPKAGDSKVLEEDVEMEGKVIFGFNTPKKKGAMALAALKTPKALATPKTPKTPARLGKTPELKRSRQTLEPKTPSHVRNRVKNQIAKIVEADSCSDFSADDSDFSPSESESSSCENETSEPDNEADDEPKTPYKGRKPIVVPILPKTPSVGRLRQSSRIKKNADYVPECESYFQTHSSSRVLTSDHTLDRLKNPLLPADRLFSLLAEMKLSPEHEASVSAMMEEYKTYFSKWLYILNEGYNILVYGLGSKRQLLQSFHRTVLSQQTVLVVNGFFPSLTIKDFLDSITNDILDAGVSPSNPHEAVDLIEEEFALIPQTHLYLIVHNLEGTMLRNSKAQSILARLAKVANIHMLASVDHLNTPLLWDQTKLSNFNFSWWDCTTLLPYSDETAFENSLLVQNSGELALSSMRSVFLSLTSNSRGIYMIIVKHQLNNKGNANYQGMPFKDLYWSCREAFLVSSDLALRAQLTEFLDHKLVKSKRSVDGSEELIIPIDASLLQQFMDEQA